MREEKKNIHFSVSYAFDTVASTNETVKAMLRRGIQAPFYVMARGQSAGRGRLGRTWHSAEGWGLYVTYALPMGLLPEAVQQLTLVAGVAVADVLGELPVEVKWPNDILISGKKVGGILCELVEDGNGGYCPIVGIGVNLRTPPEGYPDEIKDIAISLQQAGLLTFRDRFLEEVTGALEANLALWMDDFAHIAAKYRRVMTAPGTPVEALVDGAYCPGVIDGISDTGELLVRCGAAVHAIRSGEVRKV